MVRILRSSQLTTSWSNMADLSPGEWRCHALSEISRLAARLFRTSCHYCKYNLVSRIITYISRILYDYSIVQLLQPLIDLEGFPSMPVEGVAWTHAQHALFLLERHYRTHYTCRHQTVLQMFAISGICGFIARFFPTKSTKDSAIKDGPEAIALGLEILQESNIGFPVAGAIQELLRREAVGCSVKLPPGPPLAPPRSPRPTYSYNDLMDACTRPSYRQPLWSVREKFDKELAEDWYREGPEYGFKRPESGYQSLRLLQNERD